MQADFTGSVVKRVWDVEDPSEAIASNTSNITATVFNSLQEWDDDARGYNFEQGTTSNQIGGWEGGHTYRVEVMLTHVTEGPKVLAFEVTPDPLFGG